MHIKTNTEATPEHVQLRK